MQPITELINEYLAYCKSPKKLDKKTIKAYRIDLAQFIRFSSSFDSPFSIDCIREHIKYLQSTFVSSTSKRKIASVKAFFFYLEEMKILPIEKNPFHLIKMKYKEPRKLPATIPTNILIRLFRSLYSELSDAKTPYAKKAAARNVAVVELLFATGMRISELCCLVPEQLDLYGQSVRIWGKGARERIIPIENQDVLKALQYYISLHTEEIQKCGYLFVNGRGTRYSEQSARNMIRHHRDACNISLRIIPHMFRHTFATSFVDADVDIRVIQILMWHSSIKTTEIYTEVSTAKKRKVIAQKHLRNDIHSEIRSPFSADIKAANL